jgi:hypothetical protein
MAKVTSKCKNMKRWTQQTKIREENAKKGSAERMAMRELLGSKSEKAIICSWSKCRKEAGTARYEGDDQDFWQSYSNQKQDATDEERSPQRRGRW